MKYSDEFLAFRTSLLLKLSQGIYYITFIKKDGNTRQMVCTLDPKLISILSYKPKREVKSLDSIRVFDLQINQWRSFSINSLRAITGPIKPS